MRNPTVGLSLHTVPDELLLFALNNIENVTAILCLFGIHDSVRVSMLIKNELWARGLYQYE